MKKLDISKKKNMYQKWRDGELPKELQDKLDSIFRQTLDDEAIFKAGFMCHSYINEHRKEMGLD